MERSDGCEKCFRWAIGRTWLFVCGFEMRKELKIILRFWTLANGRMVVLFKEMGGISFGCVGWRKFYWDKH